MTTTRYQTLVDYSDASGVNDTVPAGETLERTGDAPVYLCVNYPWLVISAQEVESCEAKYQFVETVETIDYKAAYEALSAQVAKAAQ